jgi:hypothetical protein
MGPHVPGTETELIVDTLSLSKLALERKREDVLVVAFSDNRYRDVLLNWLVAVHRLGISNYLIVSLDEHIHDFLLQRGFPSFLSVLRGPLSNLWRLRLEVLRALCDHDLTIVHSDIDAIWLRNPVPEYFSGQSDHLVATQGTVWPEDVVRKQGFVLCCGLFSIRSSPGIRSLLDDIIEDVKRTGDDQVSLNRILNASVDWDMNLVNPYHFDFQRNRFICSEQTIRGTSPARGIKVSMLPHHLFQRIHMPAKAAYAKHLLSPKTCQGKLISFKEANCLFLDEDWKNVRFDAGTIERIAARG